MTPGPHSSPACQSGRRSASGDRACSLRAATPADEAILDAVDRRLIAATQAGLPVTPRPYHALAQRLGLPPAEVMARLERLLGRGVIRRIAAVPNHYALGYRANAMTVWDVPDAEARALGRAVGGLGFVSHCYLRPRRLPRWPFNLYAMVHGRDRVQVEAKIRRITELLGEHCRDHDVLYSAGILKKTGLRLSDAAPAKED